MMTMTIATDLVFPSIMEAMSLKLELIGKLINSKAKVALQAQDTFSIITQSKSWPKGKLKDE